MRSNPRIDPASAQYLVSWSGAVDVSAEPDPQGIYYMLTKDFVSFSDPAVLYARSDRNFIDATIVRQGDRYFMFLKDEAEGQKNIRVLSSPSLFGISAWPGEVSAPLTGAFAAEGPIALPQDGNVLLLFDRYADGTYGALRSRSLDDLEDPNAWEDITDSVLAAGLRHGSALEVPFDVFRSVAIAAAQ